MSFLFKYIDGGFMVFYTTFNNISVISNINHVGQFYWWRKPEKTTDLSQFTDKLLSHNVLLSTPHHEWGSNLQL